MVTTASPVDHDLFAELDSKRIEDARFHPGDQLEDVPCVAHPFVDDDVGVFLRNTGVTNLQSPAAGTIQQLTGRRTGIGVAEDAAGRRTDGKPAQPLGDRGSCTIEAGLRIVAVQRQRRVDDDPTA